MPFVPIQDRKERQATIIQEMSERLTSEMSSGELKSEDLKRLFTTKGRGGGLTWDEVALREELFFLAWDLCGQSYAELKRTTGMHHNAVTRLVTKRGKAIRRSPKLAKAVEAGEILLMQDRYQGRRQMIDELNQGALNAIRFGLQKLDKMLPYQAIRAAAVMIDKSLLLSGQPTSRVAKVDERGLTDQQLEKELEVLEGEAKRLGLVEGGKSGTGT